MHTMIVCVCFVQICCLSVESKAVIHRLRRVGDALSPSLCLNLRITHVFSEEHGTSMPAENSVRR